MSAQGEPVAVLAGNLGFIGFKTSVIRVSRNTRMQSERWSRLISSVAGRLGQWCKKCPRGKELSIILECRYFFDNCCSMRFVVFIHSGVVARLVAVS